MNIYISKYNEYIHTFFCIKAKANLQSKWTRPSHACQKCKKNSPLLKLNIKPLTLMNYKINMQN